MLSDPVVIQLSPHLPRDTEHLWFLDVQSLSAHMRPQESVMLTSQEDTFLLSPVVLLFPIEGQSSFGGLPENLVHVLLILC